MSNTVISCPACCGTGLDKNRQRRTNCVTVPNGTLFVRRNGKAFWSGNTHECVRHRLCAFSQESTRYCDYAEGKLERLEEQEECEKWWVDAISEQCRGDVALYIFKSLKRGEYTYPVRLDDGHKYTRSEVLEHTVKVRYTEYMYKQASQTGGDE